MAEFPVTRTLADAGTVSDGYHTFDELYAHRHGLFAVILAFAQADPEEFVIWRSKQHHVEDAEMYEGMFIAGVEYPGGVIRYHLPMSAWDTLHFVPELDRAPKWDGKTSAHTIPSLDALLHVCVGDTPQKV